MDDCEIEHSDLPEKGRITRRSFLIGSGLVVAGGVGAVYLNRADLRKKMAQMIRSVDVPVAKKPQRPKGGAIPSTAEVQAYRTFLNAHPQQYLNADEILRPHFKQRGKVYSGVPPKELWNNIVPTLRVANEIRRRLKAPLRHVVSAYRSPAYNAKCPGASKYSLHMQNRALDLVFDCSPRMAFDMTDQLRKEGYFKGGIGLYKTFIHIDTRGRNATWGV